MANIYTSLSVVMQFISGVPVTVWIVAAIAAVLLIWAGVNSAKNRKAENEERTITAAPVAPALDEPTVAESSFDGLSDDIIAVITAAVYAAMGTNCRIHSVRRVGKAPRSNWARNAVAERVAPFSKR